MSEAANDRPRLLEARRVCKSFPGVRALHEVSFRLERGSIHALMGENGAGKSTLLKIITGAQVADSGELVLEGRRIEPTSPLEAQQAGIGAVYQEINLLPSMSVAENICLGTRSGRGGLVNRRKMAARARRALARLDMTLDVHGALGGYAVATQQMVAIARALARDVRVLVLDEPTSSLDEAEVARLFRIVRKVASEGVGVIFVTHFLDQMFELCDRATILRNGELVAEHAVEGLSRQRLIEDMIGAEKAERTAGARARGPDAPPPGRTVLSGRGLRRGKSYGPFDIDVRRGEVLGLAGLLGSGRTELARLITGADAATTGRIEIQGRRTRFRSPRHATSRGIGLCPEDRRAEGIVPHLSVRENIVLALQARRGGGRLIRRRAQRKIVAELVRALSIKTASAETPVRLLSGGNQQKVILARWLAAEPELLVLDEPTRGIDIGAKGEIEELTRELCGRGVAIVFISSELSEVVRDAQRVLVLRDGRIVAQLEGEEVAMGRVMAALSAGEAHDAEGEGAARA